MGVDILSWCQFTGGCEWWKWRSNAIGWAFMTLQWGCVAAAQGLPKWGNTTGSDHRDQDRWLDPTPRSWLLYGLNQRRTKACASQPWLLTAILNRVLKKLMCGPTSTPRESDLIGLEFSLGIRVLQLPFDSQMQPGLGTTDVKQSALK